MIHLFQMVRLGLGATHLRKGSSFISCVKLKINCDFQMSGIKARISYPSKPSLLSEFLNLKRPKSPRKNFRLQIDPNSDRKQPLR